jgi:phosphohistidine phosphatase
MRLYVMRHGPAEDRAASGRDFDRRLTGAGRVVVFQVASALHTTRVASSAGPLRILTSPRQRAVETAKLVCAALVPTPAEPEVREELGGETAIPLALIVEATATGVDTLLVGHQPVVEDLVKQLVGTRAMRTGFSTATIIGLDLAPDGAGWTLATHLDPSRLPG